MPPIARSVSRRIQILEFNLRSVGIGILVLAIIVGIFFIPDLASYQAKKTVVNEESVEGAPVQANVEEVASVEQVRRPSPLDAVEELLAKKPETQTTGKTIMGGKPISWETLQANESRKIITTNKVESLNLLKRIPEEKEGSRRALDNYANVLEGVLKGSMAKALSIEEGLGTIEKADEEVTRALVRERLSRDIYHEWVRSSISKKLGLDSATQLKNKFIPPFNPGLGLSFVTVSGPLPESIKTPINPDEAPYFLSFKAVLKGDDVKSARVYRNGVVVNEGIGISATNTQGTRQFLFGGSPATGVWTIELEDSLGEKYRKSYVFFPTVSSVAVRNGNVWKPRYGSWNSVKVDPKLDALFIRSVSSSSKYRHDGNRPFETLFRQDGPSPFESF